MEQATLNAQARQDIGSLAARRLRRLGKVPGVVYGRKQASKPVLLKTEDVQHVIAHRIKMLTLSVDGVPESVLVKDVQFDTYGDEALHVDFERIAMDELIEVECPVELVGTSKGQAAGGVVEHPVTDLKIRCLPGNIPDAIKVAISHLEIGHTIHVRDIKAPESVTILTDAESILVTIRAPVKVEEVVAAAPPEEAVQEPELIRRPKAEEEEETESKK